MPQPTGFSMPLSLPRRLMCDYLHFARQVPGVPVERKMNLSEVVKARELAVPKPGWCALFTKAWGLVCARRPELRRAYLGGLFPRIYQHPVSVASIAVERPFAGEEAIFYKQLADPDTRSLQDIDYRLDRFKDSPAGQSAIERRMLRVARMPRPVRRLLWWLGLNFDGRHRSRMFGTFGVTVYASLGASSLHPLSLLTTTLNYSPLEPDGSIRVRVVYDHRVLDGGAVARAMADLESVLNHEILAELRYLEGVKAA